MTNRQQVETTYADLRPDDLVVDKSGKAWPVEIVRGRGDSTEFWLLDPVSKVRQHFMQKADTDTVTVSRIPSHADEAAKLEVDFPKSTAQPEARTTKNETTSTSTPEAGSTSKMTTSNGDNFATMEEAVAAVEEIGGTVEAEVTSAEVDAAAAATDDAPLTTIPFADMTPLEQRSHLYLLHGVYAADLKSRDELAVMHCEAHAAHAAGRLKSQHVPHVHEGA